ncbi:MAG TPA: O-antigen ligase family protein [Vicinamibacterales bacterium]|nr:O-antigen ligase family protein [Vicinamibacterales bacterium]
MESALALEAPRPLRDERFEQLGVVMLFALAGAVQFSIAIAQFLLGVAALCWLALIVVRRERVEAPVFFWPLVAYAALTLVSAAFSSDPRTSFIDCKQLVLFVLVPVTYRFVGAGRGGTLATVIVTCAAVSAAFGIFQYGIFHYDWLGQRPRGFLGHYMTFSGLLMLAIAVAVARLLFGRNGRLWSLLVMPALAFAVALTFTRSAEVGVCAAVAVLFVLRDFRLVAVLPVLAAIFFALSPVSVQQRFVSMFDSKDPNRLDRIAMLHIGERMIAAHPLTGVGPDMVERQYEQYRGPDAVNRINPHLHNDPLQIAAERGLPALAVWLWFIGAVVWDLWRRYTTGAAERFLAAGALAAVVALLTAGLFEYNFGDSEVLMLFLILVTIPAASASRRDRADAPGRAESGGEASPR